MENLLLVASFLVSVSVTIVLVPIIRALAHYFGWVDRPDGYRKLHARVTPSAGGVAIAAGLFAGMLLLYLLEDRIPLDLNIPPSGIWFAIFITVLAGFIDDVRGLSFKSKFFIQVIIAYILLLSGFRVDVSWLPFVGPSDFDQALFSIPLTVFWVVGIMNAINFIDGLDGLAAGVTLIAFTSLAMAFSLQGDFGVAVLAFPMVGALIGFLMYNSNPASIFMGDSGSLLLGTMLAVFSLRGDINGSAVSGLVVSVIALGIPITDTSLAIIRRLAGRKSVCAPDSDHIHHRLCRKCGHPRAVLILYAAALAYGGMAILASVLTLWLEMVVVVGITLVTGFWLYTLGYFERQDKTTVPDAMIASESDGHGPIDNPLLITVNPSVNEEKPNGSRSLKGFTYYPLPRPYRKALRDR